MHSESRQYRLKPERRFLRSEREHTTVLSGGLTPAHETLVETGLRALGYNSVVLPTTDLDAYALGREHCSNGLCNPAYFTIGNLLSYLRKVQQDQGLSGAEISDRYVFYTAGADGPCRFGMYESEYRLALESAGFPDFRVLVFQQSAGLVQSGSDDGLDLDPLFFLVHFKGLMLGDIVNEIFHQLRPYEIEPGATEAARQKALDALRPAMSTPQSGRLRQLVERLSDSPLQQRQGLYRRLRQAQSLLLLSEAMRDQRSVDGLRAAAACFDAVELDRLQVKPVVKITGEFWAQTTESDGNFRLFEVLERDGAELLAEPLSTWVDYLLHVPQFRDAGKAGLAAAGVRGRVGKALSRLTSRVRLPLKDAMLRKVARLLEGEYDRMRQAAGGTTLPLVDQHELADLARDYYDPRLFGGEGHLEIGKTLHYTQDGLAHMVVSLKPFGCMPSTQSDGAQPAVLADYPDVLFLPVETSSDGEGPALSRVQMMLSEARARARTEWHELLDGLPYPLDDIRAYLAERPELRHGLLNLPGHGGPVSTAARFATLVSQRMQAEGWQPQSQPQSQPQTCATPSETRTSQEVAA